MKLIQRMVLGFLAISVFAAIVGYVGFMSVNLVDNGFDEMSSQTMPAINALKDSKEAVMAVALSTIESAMIRNSSHEEEELYSREQSKKQLGEAIGRYDALVLLYFPEETELNDGIKAHFRAFIEVSDRMTALKEDGASENAILEADKAFESEKEALLDLLDESLENEAVEIDKRHGVVKATINSSMISIIIIIFTSVLSALVSGIIFAHSIADPVDELTRISAEVSRGYSGVKKVKHITDDELGSLGTSFNRMIDDLKKRDEDILLKNKELEKSKKELERKVDELERFNKLSVGRELKMIELKKKIRELEDKSKTVV